MTILDECHARGFLFCAIGGCNQAKQSVNKCLRAARMERTAMNREKAREKREKVLSVWKEIDENS